MSAVSQYCDGFFRDGFLRRNDLAGSMRWVAGLGRLECRLFLDSVGIFRTPPPGIEDTDTSDLHRCAAPLVDGPATYLPSFYEVAVSVGRLRG